MKSLILSFLFLVASIAVAQNKKPDLASIGFTDEVTLLLKGTTLEGKITQEQLIPLKTLDLKGDKAAKYKLVYYKFRTTYQHTISQDEFYDNIITEAMTRFFTDLDKNCKLMYEEIVVEHIETGKQFKIAPLNVVVKVE